MQSRRRGRAAFVVMVCSLMLGLFGGGCGDDGSSPSDAGEENPPRSDSGQDAAMADVDSAVPDGTGASAEISPDEGGKVESPDGRLTLEFPPGAVTEMTTVSVHEVEAADGIEGALGPTYVFEPDGATFEQPVAVTIAIDTAQLNEIGDSFEPKVVQGPSETVFAFLVGQSGGEDFVPDNQSFDVLSDPDEAYARGEISHFSQVAAVATAALLDNDFQLAVSFKSALDGEIGDTNLGEVKAAAWNPVANAVLPLGAPTGLSGVTYVSSKPAAATIVEIAKESNNSKRPNTATCVSADEGEFTATIAVQLDGKTPNGVREIRSSTTLVQPFKCSEPAAPACTPNSTAAPTTAPDITTDLYNDDICRAAWVTIFGTDFDTAGTCVAAGSGPEQLVNATSSTQLKVQLAEDQPTGATTISVRTNAGTDVTTSTLNVLADVAPLIESISPTSGPPGTQVTATGKHLTGLDYATLTGAASSLIELTVGNVTDTSFTFTVSDSGFGLTTGELHFGTLLTTNCNGTPDPSITFTVE